MVYCIKCGEKNDGEAQYCSKCGNSLTDKLKNDNTVEKNIQNFANGVERAGIKAGEKIEKSFEKIGQETKDIGLKMEKAKDRVGSYLDNWWDRTFKIFGPIVSSFIVIIALRFIIEGLRITAEENPVMGVISNFLFEYLLLIFVFILISSYNSYFYRKYKKFQWFSPVITAFIFVFISWIIVNILSIVGTSMGNLELINAEVVWREQYMLMIFVIVLLLGYLIKVASVAWEKK